MSSPIHNFSVDSPLQQFTCKDCGNIVTKKGELKRHVSTHDSTKKQKCTICAKPLSKSKPLMKPKSCEHEANPSRECEVRGESVDNVEKHTEKIHEEIGKPCTICQNTFTISKMKRHLRSMHETPRNTYKACQYMHRKSHSNNKIIETKNDNIENCPFCDPKFQTKDVLKNHVTSTHVKKISLVKIVKGPSSTEEFYSNT